jgi:hypothetical protein
VNRVRLFALAGVLALVLSPFVSSARAGSLAAEWQAAYDTHHFTDDEPPGLFQRRVERTLSIDIDAPLERVFPAYAEVDNHIGRHPFNRGQETHAESEADGVHVRNYTTIEEVPILFFSTTIHTHAQQSIYAADHAYTVDTWTSPDVFFHGVVQFQDLGGGRTRVSERVVFQTNLFLIDFTVKNGVASHEQGMQALKRDIEAGVI